jgi:hypothetical protein
MMTTLSSALGAFDRKAWILPKHPKAALASKTASSIQNSGWPSRMIRDNEVNILVASRDSPGSSLERMAKKANAATGDRSAGI